MRPPLLLRLNVALWLGLLCLNAQAQAQAQSQSPALPTQAEAEARSELFVDFGVAATHLRTRYPTVSRPAGATTGGIHLGFGARRSVNDNSDIGFRIEVDSVDAATLLAVRALDYRRHRSKRLAFNFFIGAARLNLATPAFGYYFGLGVQWKEAVSDFDLSIDLSYGDKLARDNLLPDDLQGGSPDNFHDALGLKVYLSRRF